MGQIKLITNILKSNEEFSIKNKNILKNKDIFTINIMSSPGSGKTSILEKLIENLKGIINIAVIEGDIFTIKDAERIGAQGIEVVQINTEGSCHLDSNMINKALNEINLDKIDLLIIENVGNLVCPAEFNIGEDIKIAVLSIAEGNDKVLKYPLMFEKSDVIILNKTDLLPYTNFDINEFYVDVNKINPKINVFETSCFKDSGFDNLGKYIIEKIAEKKGK
ncbi:Hydrogenase isoenzymes nickel incorporation protein hypB [uncultured Clostridium sp.]|uniref:hydrogenase nickel incorporation protein HypB n=1 Tax=uncultured Clostridium sp. TaxID=59620 RepID=UPI000820FFF1|nr:hydrogenase nickel incorporation protein HypB [uncultured Clostridium sp.]SCJ50835.1 Hydrogenase isoenzymes nickel incorporation protein hypB [uncultured Clostridium sp.]